MNHAEAIHTETIQAIESMRLHFGGEIPPGLQTRHSLEGPALVSLSCRECDVTVAQQIFDEFTGPEPLGWMGLAVKSHAHWRAWAEQRVGREGKQP